ncbi:sialate O-acetylesterase [Mangrovimonas sp. YM274]|uniref:sialate O-acetylesterase n=1 Tax=Mangrovimonas sp. YM274 TaxID=3070660 RepID=UPI0027DE43DD|nr:sialate O-acetylesterase [Mangrovimonas sp. YM274]WMI67740.1 sialate O-acetylesterase [Mangrovimonas sp. YM274]
MKLLKIAFVAVLFFQFTVSYSQIKLPQLVSNGMVLQRDQDVKIWGWSSPYESVTLTFQNKKYRTKADSSGAWSINLPPQKAGGPFSMKLQGKNKIEISDILFGDVWLCSGQSNMVNPIERVKEKYPEAAFHSNYPEIRNFFIPTKTNLEGPQNDLPQGQWKSAVGEDVLGFGSVSYFFAKDVYEKYGIPIGLINASVGGTPIESWISEAGYKEFPNQLELIQENKDYIKHLNSKPTPNSNSQYSSNNTTPADKGLSGDLKWFEKDYIPKGWRNYNIPGYWEDQGLKNLNGVVWFRKEIDVPESMTGAEAKLYMGRIINADEVYVNGIKVGNITYQYPPRRYTVSGGILKAGKNIITIRVTNRGGKGGFVPDKPYYLTAKGQEIDLKGTWQYKVGEVFEPFNYNNVRQNESRPINAQNQPTSLYNAMIAPIRNQKIKGVLWYQGESNTGNPKAYEGYLKALINDWRNQWNAEELPFLIVQLVNFGDIDFLPTESNWAELREAQLKALSLPNTALAVGIDLGEWNDIHPLNKADVGKRLALGAMKLTYGEDIVHSGPIYKSSKIVGGKIVLSFDFVGSGLISIDDEPLSRFEIAGEDQYFVWADAKIVGETVEVSSPEVKNPRYVRYAWADNPLGANLYNKEGLPASPFRTYDPDKLNDRPWQGKQAAVVLTYDDALNVHLDHVLPLLNQNRLKATFYVSTYSDAFRNRINDWRRLAQNGHELGNHTIFHPCIGKDTRPWVNKNYDMGTYTVERMVDEIKINNTLLEAVDGKTNRTFAFTCGDFTVNGNDFFIDDLKDDLAGARAVRHEMHKLEDIDIYDIDSYAIVGETGEQMIDLVKKAVETNSLLVFLFHGVGGEHSMNVSLEAHKQLVEYLKEHEDEVWTASMIEVIENIKKNQSN